MREVSVVCRKKSEYRMGRHPFLTSISARFSSQKSELDEERRAVGVALRQDKPSAVEAKLDDFEVPLMVVDGHGDSV